MKSIVIYYSRSGNTKAMAERIAADFESDMLFVEPRKKYSSYFTSVLTEGKDLLSGKITTAQTEMPDLSDYDTVFIGFPIWYGDAPSFFLDFISECKLENKTVIPFASSVSADIKECKKLYKLLENCTVKHPLNYTKTKKDDYEYWKTLVSLLK